MMYYVTFQWSEVTTTKQPLLIHSPVQRSVTCHDVCSLPGLVLSLTWTLNSTLTLNNGSIHAVTQTKIPTPIPILRWPRYANVRRGNDKQFFISSAAIEVKMWKCKVRCIDGGSEKNNKWDRCYIAVKHEISDQLPTKKLTNFWKQNGPKNSTEMYQTEIFDTMQWQCKSLNTRFDAALYIWR